MGRLSFVGMLFAMALACLGIAVSASSWGWAFGGAALVIVAIYALQQSSTESESEGGPEAASNRFIVFALLAVAGGIAAIGFLLQG